jgi:polyisoprenoid-binding protein YceI
MKHTLKLSLVLLAISTTMYMSSCSDKKAGDKARVDEKQDAAAAKGATYKADPAASTIGFTGYGVGKNHPGTFKISDGTVTVEDNKVTSGKFMIDIKSVNMKEKGMVSDKLGPHLLSPDFFDAEKYNSGVFEITKVEPYTASAGDTSVVPGANYMVSGNLTLKEVSKNVSFPAKIEVTDNMVTALADFDIDRNWWNISYNNDKSLGDKFISPMVNIHLDVKATK